MIAYLLLQVKLNLDVSKELMNYPEVVEIVPTYGQYDFVLTLSDKSSDKLRSCVQRIRLIEDIRSTLTLVQVNK